MLKLTGLIDLEDSLDKELKQKIENDKIALSNLEKELKSQYQELETHLASSRKQKLLDLDSSLKEKWPKMISEIEESLKSKVFSLDKQNELAKEVLSIILSGEVDGN